MCEVAISVNVRVFESMVQRCTAGQTTTQRESVLARLEREAHQETEEEDAVCGVEAYRMC